ncbi:hypothetical protein QUF64_11435 [Anaerolineales bacterium HSG6]|nr:hypothetical protein [Anaerolineales bacterium HSG6]MDM8532281.1 hypothetical protein [Anaerolineales bacterium HSG25]
MFIYIVNNLVMLGVLFFVVGLYTFFSSFMVRVDESYIYTSENYGLFGVILCMIGVICIGLGYG